MKLTTQIGDALARDIVQGIMDQLERQQVEEIELIARGRHISRAIDVLEILKRELRIYDPIKNIESAVSITTLTEDLVSKEGLQVKVSKITIKLPI
jgi:DNA-binding protein Alba